ncbi:MAG: metallophosphoesterase, partial [Spirochaetes bacterium]
CISGHIHESVGIDRLEDTLLVNPGAFKSGRYALIELEEDVPKVELLQVR